MKHSGGIEFWRCGFGYDGGLFPRLRLGLLVIGWYRGSLTGTAEEMAAELAALRDDLKGATAEIARLRGRIKAFLDNPGTAGAP